MTSILRINDKLCSGLYPILILLLVVAVVISSKQTPSPIAPPSEFDLLDDNLASVTRELNRTSTINQPSRSQANRSRNGQDSSSISLYKNQAQSRAQLADPLHQSGSSQSHNAQIIARNVSINSAIAGTIHQSQLPPQAATSRQQPRSSTSTANANNLSIVRNKWRQMENSIHERLTQVSLNLKQILAELLAISDKKSTPISLQCRWALTEFIAKLEARELWASQMLDSSALRLPNGLLEGTLTELGHFDECLAIDSNNNDQNLFPMNHDNKYNKTIFGQYCSLHIKPVLINRPRLHTICRRLPTPLSNSSSVSSSQVVKFLAENSHQFLYAGLRLGICTPSKCGLSDLQHLLNAYLDKYELVGQVKNCQQQERHHYQLEQSVKRDSENFFVFLLKDAYYSSTTLQSFDIVQQCILLVFVLLLMLNLLGTWLDTSYKRKSGEGYSTINNVLGGLTDPPLSGLEPPSQAPLTTTNRRWKEYKVCRSSTNTCCSDISGSAMKVTNAVPVPIYQANQKCCLAQHQTVGLQRNPIAELVEEPASAASCPYSCSSSSSSAASSSMPESTTTPLSSSFSSMPLQHHHQPHHHHNHTHDYNHHHHHPINPMLQAHSQPKEHIRHNIFKSTNENQLWPKTRLVDACRTSKSHDDNKLTDVKRETSKFVDFLVCFSLKSNLRTIGKLSSSNVIEQQIKEEPAKFGPTKQRLVLDIKVIHGLRTLSMFWIIFGHTIGLVGPEMLNNLFPLAQLSCTSRLLQALLNTTLAVDTFFMISGLVTVVSFARKCKSALGAFADEVSTITTTDSDSGNDGDGKKVSSPNKAAYTSNEYEDEDEDDLLVLQSSFQPQQKQHQHQHQNQRRQAAGFLVDHLDQGKFRSRETKRLGAAANVIDLDEISSINSTASSMITSLGSSSALNYNGNKHRSKTDEKLDGTNEQSMKQTVPKQQQQTSNKPLKQQTISQFNEAGGWPSDFKPLSWLLLRYLRLTPAYATIIGLSVVLPALGSGPFWAETVGQLGPVCRSNWWLNLIYVNNFLETDKLCLIHSWYLSNDWQFFLLTLILFAAFYKSKKLTLLMFVSSFLASSATTFVATIENQFPPTIVTTSPAVAERWQFIYQLYYKPWPHLPSYLVGLLTGYLIIKLKINSKTPIGTMKNNLSTGGRRFCWILFSSIGLAVLNSIYPWNMGFQVDPILTGLHSSTFRTLWSTSCAWLVYALITKPRNPLALILSWHGFQITSRLTYCAYLVHPLIIYYHFGTLRERIDSSPYGQLHRFAATLVQSYLFAFILSLTVEGPFCQIQRLITRHSDKRGDKRETKIPERYFNHLRMANYGLNRAYWPETFSNKCSFSNVKLNRIDPQRKTIDQTSLEQHQTIVDNNRIIDINLNNNNNNSNLNSIQTYDGHKPEPNVDFVSQTNSHNSSSANDTEFQKKLAQAIGRGFKMRTKIVNGSVGKSSSKHQAARRLGPTKRLPYPNRSQLAPIFATTGQKMIPEPLLTKQSVQQIETAPTSRSMSMSTFVAPPVERLSSNSKQDKRTTVVVNSKDPIGTGDINHCPFSGMPNEQKFMDKQNYGHKINHLTNLDLKEMIQMKHKLLTRNDN